MNDTERTQTLINALRAATADMPRLRAVVERTAVRHGLNASMICHHCGSVLSAVTFTCVRGKYCPGEKARPNLSAGGLDGLCLNCGRVSPLEYTRGRLAPCACAEGKE